MPLCGYSYVDQAAFELQDQSDTASWVMWIKVHATMPGNIIFINSSAKVN